MTSQATKNILLVGVGGQGTILASKVLSEGLLQAGYDVKMSEIHGMSQRGGSVSTHVRYGERVYSPVIDPGTADILVSFEKVEAVRWLSYLKPGGMLVVNDYEIHPLTVLTGAAQYPEDIIPELKAAVPNILVVDAGRMATELGNVKAQNILLLGALVTGMKLDNIDWQGVLKQLIPPRLYDLNVKAFALGRSQLDA